MSCLPVKNLPLSLNQPLREHPEYKDGPGGTLTDVKDILKHDSTYRRFALVGYNTDAEAEKTKRLFDRTFVDSLRTAMVAMHETSSAESQFTLSMNALSIV